MTPEFWDQILDINVRAAFFCCQAATPLMRQRGGGSIINIGSVHAFGTRPRMLPYGISKSALYALTMNLARILAPDHIRVNWVTVGWVLTEKEFEVQAGEGTESEELLARGDPFRWASSLPLRMSLKPASPGRGRERRTSPALT